MRFAVSDFSEHIALWPDATKSVYDILMDWHSGCKEGNVMVSGHVKPDYPIADWDRGPWNRWTFQHVGEVVPTTVVKRGPAVSAIKTTLMDVATIRFKIDDQECTVENWLKGSETDGFAVLSGNSLVYERYFNGMKANTLHLSQSVAKSVTATAFGILAGRGEIDAEALITDYLPELETTGYRGAKIRHVLDMQSGVYFDETSTDPHSDVGKMDVASGWKPMPKDGDWPATILDQVLTLKKRVREHGALFEYRSIETDVMAMAMERATGKKLAAIVSQEIWQPIGASEDATFTTDRAGYALACGGFNACLMDYARFGQLWANRGLLQGRRILPDAWVDDTLQGDTTLFQGDYTDVLPNGAYRNQFWLRDAGRSTILCRGIFGQLITIDMDRNFVAVKLSSWPEPSNPVRTRMALAAIEAIADAVG